jgi:Family of unknown function (DUF5985)
MNLPATVFFLCMVASLVCMVLLIRGWLQSRTTLLLWSSLCFVALTFNNLFLFLDLVLLPQIDFFPLRQASSLAAVAVLLYGFVWETD